MESSVIEVSVDGGAAVQTEAQELDAPTIHKDTFEPDMNPYKAHGADDDAKASMSDSSMDDHVLPIADIEGNAVHYPEDDVDEEYRVRQSCIVLTCHESNLIYCFLIRSSLFLFQMNYRKNKYRRIFRRKRPPVQC